MLQTGCQLLEVAQANEPSLDFREFLRAELVRRCRLNPRYSLRAFARKLELESSYLSKLLSGKRSITPRVVRRVCDRLELDGQIAEQFTSQLPSHRSRRESEPHLKVVALDQYRLISDWYHYAILELTTLADFSSDTASIASRLGIAEDVAGAAVERLLRLGLLAQERGGKLVGTGNHTTVGSIATHEALRKMQKEIMHMGLEAMDTIAPELRDQSSVTLAIPMSAIPELQKEIKRFRRRMIRLMDERRKKDAVYQLSISFFPVTRSARQS